MAACGTWRRHVHVQTAARLGFDSLQEDAKTGEGAVQLEQEVGSELFRLQSLAKALRVISMEAP